LGYGNKHKGFKCLDLSTGHLYISRDVIFDENIFPFAKLDPNIDPRLWYEVLLLPPLLTNPSSGDESATNHMTNVKIPVIFVEDFRIKGLLEQEIEIMPSAQFPMKIYLC
jgi:hypothetical protein